ncbi:MAG: hypothetical protein IKS45_02235 [Thermoguttaceae bacterium]|nr:hypothetical protein [Thermoguttaceae bacterium]MBR6435306.1 hypothetical protein [Thermoguttaceae bacterium]
MTFRGARRLDAALSSVPLKDMDKPGSRQSPAAKNVLSRKERKEMKGRREAFALTPKGLHFYNRRFSTSGKKTTTKQNIDKHPFRSFPHAWREGKNEKG